MLINARRYFSINLFLRSTYTDSYSKCNKEACEKYKSAKSIKNHCRIFPFVFMFRSFVFISQSIKNNLLFFIKRLHLFIKKDFILFFSKVRSKIGNKIWRDIWGDWKQRIFGPIRTRKRKVDVKACCATIWWTRRQSIVIYYNVIDELIIRFDLSRK